MDVHHALVRCLNFYGQSRLQIRRKGFYPETVVRPLTSPARQLWASSETRYGEPTKSLAFPAWRAVLLQDNSFPLMEPTHPIRRPERINTIKIASVSFLPPD